MIPTKCVFLGTAGVEPAAIRLKARCSTTELRTRVSFISGLLAINCPTTTTTNFFINSVPLYSLLETFYSASCLTFGRHVKLSLACATYGQASR